MTTPLPTEFKLYSIRETDRQTEGREIQRGRERQTDKGRDIQTDRQTEGREIQREGETYRQGRERQADRQMEGDTD